MELLMAATSRGVTFVIILLVMVFFQVIMHNVRSHKQHKELLKRISELEKKLNRAEENL